MEPQLLDVNHIWLNETDLCEGLQGKTAIHLSDLHLKKIGRREKKILKIIDEINPDFVFLTGDYVKWDGDYEIALDYMARLGEKCKTWAVMGDYDYSNSRKSCLFCHDVGTGRQTSRYTVTFLRNDFQKIDFAESDIQIGGLDLGAGSGVPTIELPSVILSHSPLLFDEIDNERNILMLSGDTHGGQIGLPAWFWKMIGYEKTAKYSHGVFREENKMMYVSKGIGTSHIPIRLFRAPEVVVIHF